MNWRTILNKFKTRPDEIKKQIYVAMGLRLGVVMLLALFKFIQISRAIAEAENRTPPPEAVTSYIAKEEVWEERLNAVGSLAAINGTTPKVEQAGRIVKIAFDSGTPVTQGQLLLALDTAVEEGELKSVEAEVAMAQVNITRAKTLRERNAYSQADLDNAEQRVKEANAQAETLRAKIAQKKIVAPFTGRVGIRQVSLGQTLAAGEEVVSLNSFDPININLNVPQSALSKIKLGQAIEVRVDAYPDQVFKGVVGAINPDVDPLTRMIWVQGTIANADEKLRSGMFAQVSILLSATSRFVTIPASSINYSPYGNMIYVIEGMKDPNGREYRGVRQQVIKIGEHRGDQVAVLSGLKVNEEVVSSGTFKLRPNAEVAVNSSIQPGNAPSPTPEDR